MSVNFRGIGKEEEEEEERRRRRVTNGERRRPEEINGIREAIDASSIVTRKPSFLPSLLSFLSKADARVTICRAVLAHSFIHRVRKKEGSQKWETKDHFKQLPPHG